MEEEYSHPGSYHDQLFQADYTHPREWIRYWKLEGNADSRVSGILGGGLYEARAGKGCR